HHRQLAGLREICEHRAGGRDGQEDSAEREGPGADSNARRDREAPRAESSRAAWRREQAQDGASREDGSPEMTPMAKRKTRRWVKTVTTDSTHPPAGLFTKDAATIARTLASKRVSPKGPGSGMRMLTFFINRAGHNLTAKRRNVLNRAKSLLSERVRRAKKRKLKKSP